MDPTQFRIIYANSVNEFNTENGKIIDKIVHEVSLTENIIVDNLNRTQEKLGIGAKQRRGQIIQKKLIHSVI